MTDTRNGMSLDLKYRLSQSISIFLKHLLFDCFFFGEAGKHRTHTHMQCILCTFITTYFKKLKADEQIFTSFHIVYSVNLYDSETTNYL